MLKTLVQKTYCIDVSVDRMNEILKENILCEQLNGLEGIIKVEYDGHFGPYIFMTIEVGVDTDETWRWAEEYIKG